jgi:hypothetical protein
MVREEMSGAGLTPPSSRSARLLSDDDAERERFVGSPTIRTDGRDLQEPGRSRSG